MKNRELISKAIYYQLTDVVEISAIFTHGDNLIFRARPRVDPEQAREVIRNRLEKSGFRVSFRDESTGFLIDVYRAKKFVLPRINVILFGLTLITIFLAPYLHTGAIFYPGAVLKDLMRPGVIGDRLEFTIALMAILLFHEFGHYLAGKRRGILMSLPFFLPAPTFIGTFGAVIRSRSPITNRRDLIEVGATGPVAGFFVAILVLAVGLANSTVIEAGPEPMFTVGNSLLYKFLKLIIIGPIPDGHVLYLSEAALAGWVGLLVTMLNLLPLGQLDGGHIVYGLAGRNQYIVARVLAAVLIGLGFWWFGWWFFGALVFFFGLNHPPTIQDDMPIGRPAKILGILAVIIFIISFIPVPFSIGR